MEKDYMDSEVKMAIIANESVKMMITKNREREDNWKAMGLLGLFTEVRTMYIRFRGKVWGKLEEMEHESTFNVPKYNRWKAEVKDCLIDLRNYTILAQMALDNDNFYGSLKDPGVEGELKGLTEEEIETLTKLIRRIINFK